MFFVTSPKNSGDSDEI